MSMDIRSFFGKKPSGTMSEKEKDDDKKKKRRKSTTKRKVEFSSDSESDSNFLKTKDKKELHSSKLKKFRVDSKDEPSPVKSESKPKVKTNAGKKRSRVIFFDSDSDEAAIPPKQNVPSQSKLNVTVTSKHFDDSGRVTDIQDGAKLFGSAAAKRSCSMLEKTKALLNKHQQEKEDAVFAALCAQMDDVGDASANWMPEGSLKGDSTDKGVAMGEGESISSGYGTTKEEGGSSVDKDEDAEVYSEKIIVQCPTEKYNEKFGDGYEMARALLNMSPLIPVKSSPKKSKVGDEKGERVVASVGKKADAGGKCDLNASSKKGVRVVLTQPERVERGKTPPLPLPSTMWVEKYKPQSSNKIIGQHTDKSNANKLREWLKNWHANRVKLPKTGYAAGSWNKDPTGASFKAALLSGPPGVGKTTTVTLLCKELHLDAVEFNASDTRSKTSLRNHVSTILSNKTLATYAVRDANGRRDTDAAVVGQVLVMDEVDGMAGNEDRGGMQELIQLIKASKVPVVCMCNDRNHAKIRSLVNYCFDLRFHKPRVEQILGYMKTVCFKENLKISNERLTDIITSANQDIRLILNHLSTIAADKNSTNMKNPEKDVKMGPWDVLRKVFSPEDHKTMTMIDKMDLFFYDYSIAPLFVHENYLSVKPAHCGPQDKAGIMDLCSKTAASLCMGDKIDKVIRSTNNWSLLPMQGAFSSYIPGEVMEGHLKCQILFPSWLGKNSKRNKADRILQDICVHTRLKTFANKEAMLLDYARPLRDKILRPLLEEGSAGAREAVETMKYYSLLKEDFDGLRELCQWPGHADEFAKLDSKVKAAFTRFYNQEMTMCPYSLGNKKGGKAANAPPDDGEFPDEDEGGGGKDEGESSDEEEMDAMIVKRKAKPSKADKGEAPASRASTSKGKAATTPKPKANRGRGKK